MLGYGKTRSWFRVTPQEPVGTLVQFGSAVTARRRANECRVPNAAGISSILFKYSAALDVEAVAQDANVRLNKAQCSEAGKHLPENLGDKPFELTLVELKERPRKRGLRCTKVLSARRSSGSGRQQMPVLGQNDFIDGVNDAVRRDKIRLFDAGPVHPYVSGDYRCR